MIVTKRNTMNKNITDFKEGIQKQAAEPTFVFYLTLVKTFHTL